MEHIFSVSAKQVDPNRLSSLLRSEFGRGGYRIEMQHSTYRVYAKYSVMKVEPSAFSSSMR
ncbi:hypothetical protein GGS24DRAFT_474020 [Hypoxylon argillaceum]|nr:hypothetical protein GGS24DRAFT_474020 [Hypoxylon argillaceum]